MSEDENAGLTVTVPATATETGDLENLLAAKGNLFKKALGIGKIGIEADDETISFPWFSEMPEPGEVKAYTEFIAALCKMSKDLKCVSATERPVENEKYAFRCFLLRNLSGNSAWRNRVPEKEADNA